MSLSKLWGCLTALFLFLSPNPSFPLVQISVVEPNLEITSVLSSKKLFSVPARKGTVGTLLFYEKNGKLYMLLGREDKAGTSSKAGQYCDLGGRLELDGTSVFDNLKRELMEESAGAFYLTRQHLLSTIVLYKETTSHRDVYYVLRLLPKTEFLSQRDLYRKREEARIQGKPPSYLEKDKFLWIEEERLPKAFQKTRRYWVTVRDIQGQTHHIRLREFFANDCLSHPDFQKSIEKLRPSLKQAYQ